MSHPLATPLTPKLEPLYPIDCPICGARLGSFYRDGLSYRAFARLCTKRCQILWAARKRRRRWRELPPDLRQAYLATGVLDHAIRSAGAS